jgi:hypothetical protein
MDPPPLMHQQIELVRAATSELAAKIAEIAEITY